MPDYPALLRWQVIPAYYDVTATELLLLSYMLFNFAINKIAASITDECFVFMSESDLQELPSKRNQ